MIEIRMIVNDILLPNYGFAYTIKFYIFATI